MSVELLFQPGQIGPLTIKNRFVRAATAESMSRPDGTITEDYTNMYLDLARGGAGLIFTGQMYVHPRGRGGHYHAGIHRDDVVPAFKRFTDRIHDSGGIIFGVNSGTPAARAAFRRLRRWRRLQSKTSYRPRQPVEATEGDIREAIEAFGNGARRLREAGFDGVHVHAGHGYLISEFSSPHANRRDDDWGGDAERRSRFLYLRSIVPIRNAKSVTTFPVTFKLGMADSMDEGGLTIDESVPRAAQLEAEGLDALEVSVGVIHALTKSATCSSACRSRELGRTW